MTALNLTLKPTAPPALNLYGLSRDDIVMHLRSSPEHVDKWLSGEARRPPYFDAALKAARAGLHPIGKAVVAKYYKELGVPKSQADYWMTADQIPMPARMAVAWIIHSRITGRG